MKILVQSTGTQLTPSLKDYIHLRLRFALRQFGNRIKHVWVNLSSLPYSGDVNAERCLIQVQLRDKPQVVIENTQNKLTLAIDLATHNVKRTLSRRISQHNNLQPARSS